MVLSEVSGSINWKQNAVQAGLKAVPNTQTIAATLALVTTAGNANESWFSTGTVASGGGTVTFNLQNLTGPIFNEAISALRAYALLLTVVGSAVLIGPGASNGLVWFFDDATATEAVKDGGLMVHGETQGTTVDNTHKNLTLTNNGGVNATYTLALAIGT